ncbi:hypothetical protein [Polaromonas sp.]|uniref:hypothetical protein n=1 Tax=Polaromonas sp. TaxID=1869339 RepID=UPI001A226406|nr:hypothetical protein [Xanthomonadaceae bacterium]
MRAYQFERTIPSSHSFTVELPPDSPVGPAKIIVLFPDEQPLAAPSTPRFASMTEFNTWLMTQPPTGRTVEEIDRQIQEERDSWES